MKLPRDLSGTQLVRLLGTLGYVPTRQVGSHIRLTRAGDPVHHITVPDHDSLRVGTLNSILREVSAHLGVSREELVQEMF